MSKDDSFADAFKKWKDMARQLLVPKICIDLLDIKFKCNNFSPEDIYHEILDNWKSRTSDEATLLNLLTAFRNCHLNSTAKHIETHYVNLGLYTVPSVIVEAPYQVRSLQREISSLKRKVFNFTTYLILKLASKCWSCILMFFLGFRNINSFIVPVLILMLLLKYFASTLCSSNSIHLVRNSSTVSFSKPSCSTEPFTNISKILASDVIPITIHKVHLVIFPENVTLFKDIGTDYSTKQPFIWVPINATISSWKDFQVLMNSNTNDSHIVDLSIVMDNPFDWNDADNLYNTHRIRSLSVNGRFSLDLLTEIIKKLPSLQNLKFDNNENKLCDRNRGQLSLVRNIPEKFVYLPVLKFLYLKDFSNCIEILELLVRSFDIKQLRKLAIDEIVDNHNIHHIQELISKFDTIQILDLHFVNHSTKYFYKNDFTRKSKLSRIYFNSLSLSSNYSFISIGSNFCFYIGHLSHFENMLGCLPFSDFVNMLECTQLKNLTITVCFGILKDIKLQESFPNLEYFHVKLKFADYLNCPSISDIKRLRFRERGKTVKEFSISSNCPIRKGKDGKNKNSDFKRTRVTKNK